MAKSKVTAAPDNYQAESDAGTLTRAQEVQSDPTRHKKAVDHLEKTNQNAAAAAKDGRKRLQKNTKNRMKKVFGNDPSC